MAFWDADRGVAFSDSVDGQLRRPHHQQRRPQLGRPSTESTAAGARRRRRVCRERHERRGQRDAACVDRDLGRPRAAIDRWRAVRGAWHRHRSPPGPSAGPFSIAFRDSTHGVVVGGDYRQEGAAVNNAAVTVGRRPHVATDQGTLGIPLGGAIRAATDGTHDPGRRPVGRGSVSRRWTHVAGD